MSKQSSSQATFDSFFTSESDAIFRFCLIRVSDREQALDIIQETFLRLWKKLEEGAKMDNIRAFLYTVSHHLIIDWYRKKKAVPFKMFETDSEEDFEIMDEETGGDSLELEAEGRYLIERIHLINPPYRQAVYLRYVEGLPPPEIAKALGISANTASVRVHRGLHELRRLTGYDLSRASLRA